MGQSARLAVRATDKTVAILGSAVKVGMMDKQDMALNLL
jgi:hypothetical protein